jgi:hypothetical protein
VTLPPGVEEATKPGEGRAVARRAAERLELADGRPEMGHRARGVRRQTPAMIVIRPAWET